MDDRTLARFMSKVEVQPNGCWHWTAAIEAYGYGRFSIGGRGHQSHRVSYEHFRGQIPNGLQVDHVCHSRDKSCPGGRSCLHRRCVRPEHLEAVDVRTNLLRGRTLAAANAGKDYCANGHEFTPENTYYPPGVARRMCRDCHRTSNRLATRARRAAAKQRGGTEGN